MTSLRWFALGVLAAAGYVFAVCVLAYVIGYVEERLRQRRERRG